MVRTVVAALALLSSGATPKAPAKAPAKGAVVYNNFSITPPQGFNEEGHDPDGKKFVFKGNRPPATVSIEMLNLVTPKNGDCRKDLADKLTDEEKNLDHYRKLERVKGKLWVQEKVDYANDSAKRVIIGCDERTGMIVRWEQKAGDVEASRKAYNRMIDSVEITPLFGKRK